jgi:hypothetical protein
MSDEMQLTQREFLSAGLAYRPPAARERNLGEAILLVAIADYRGLDDDDHEDAKAFLYPRTPVWQDHFDWVVGVTEGLNPAWLRDMLDRFQWRWNRERRRRKVRHENKTKKTSLARGKSNGHDVAKDSRVDGIAVQAARTAGEAWHVDAAARL